MATIQYMGEVIGASPQVDGTTIITCEMTSPCQVATPQFVLTNAADVAAFPIGTVVFIMLADTTDQETVATALGGSLTNGNTSTS